MERGDLHRHVHARQWTPGRRVEPWRRGPVRRLAAERFDQLEVACLVGVRLRVAEARLAEDVEGECLTGAPSVERRAPRLGRRAPRDEAPRQAADRLAQHYAD